MRPRLPSKSDAENLATRAFSFLAGEPEQLGRFLAQTGLGPDTIRTAAGEPWFLGAVLDFILKEERLLIDFAHDANIDPALPALARAALERA